MVVEVLTLTVFKTGLWVVFTRSELVKKRKNLLRFNSADGQVVVYYACMHALLQFGL